MMKKIKGTAQLGTNTPSPAPMGSTNSSRKPLPGVATPTNLKQAVDNHKQSFKQLTAAIRSNTKMKS
jgi:hypothetical protein